LNKNSGKTDQRKELPETKMDSQTKHAAQAFMYHDASYILANNNALCYSAHNCANTTAYNQLKSLQQ